MILWHTQSTFVSYFCSFYFIFYYLIIFLLPAYVCFYLLTCQWLAAIPTITLLSVQLVLRCFFFWFFFCYRLHIPHFQSNKKNSSEKNTYINHSQTQNLHISLP